MSVRDSQGNILSGALIARADVVLCAQAEMMLANGRCL